MSLEMVSESHYICPQGSLTQQQQATALTYPPLSFHSACETQANTSKTLAFPYCSTRNTFATLARALLSIFAPNQAAHNHATYQKNRAHVHGGNTGTCEGVLPVVHLPIAFQHPDT